MKYAVAFLVFMASSIALLAGVAQAAPFNFGALVNGSTDPVLPPAIPALQAGAAAAIAAADVATIGQSDNLDQILSLLGQLVDRWDTLGGLALMILLCNLMISILKSKMCGGWFGAQAPHIQSALVVALGQLLAILTLRTQGASWMSASVTGLFVSGGAVTTYEMAVRPIFQAIMLAKASAPAPAAAPAAPAPEAPKTETKAS